MGVVSVQFTAITSGKQFATSCVSKATASETAPVARKIRI
jgi:hypothetical protein